MNYWLSTCTLQSEYGQALERMKKEREKVECWWNEYYKRERERVQRRERERKVRLALLELSESGKNPKTKQWAEDLLYYSGRRVKGPLQKIADAELPAVIMLAIMRENMLNK